MRVEHRLTEQTKIGARVVARQGDEPLSDLAIIGLLGGLYLGGLATFVSAAYLLSQTF